MCLAPLHLPRETTRPVSYYAFFKGWLLLSNLLAVCAFSLRLPLSTSLGTLAGGLGVSLSTPDVSTRCLSPVIELAGIRSLQWFGKLL